MRMEITLMGGGHSPRDWGSYKCKHCGERHSGDEAEILCSLGKEALRDLGYVISEDEEKKKEEQP